MVGDPGTDLCRACGLCCGGALASSGALTADEAVRLRKRLTVVEPQRAAGPMFAIPCSAHGPSGCTIYRERPVTCVEYTCLLLRRLERGEVTLEVALRTVSELRAMITRVEAELPAGLSLWDRASKLRGAAEPDAKAERRRLAGTLMDLKVLERRLARDLDDRVGRPGTSSGEGKEVTGITG